MSGTTTQIHSIRSAEEYQSLLAEIASLIEMNPDPNTAESERIELLSQLIEVYEGQHYASTPPTPIEAIKFRMVQGRMTVADMGPYLGSPEQVNEILNGSRPLSTSMIRRLGELGIPTDVLDGAKTAAS